VGYGLMNEPHDLGGPCGGARRWEQVSAHVVGALREVDSRTTVVVGGSSWSHTRGWSGTHPRPWIERTFEPVRTRRTSTTTRTPTGCTRSPMPLSCDRLAPRVSQGTARPRSHDADPAVT